MNSQKPHPTCRIDRAAEKASDRVPGIRRASGAAVWALVALVLALPGAALAQPTVNGLFYGDGDDALYQPYATSSGGSVLYSYLDAPTTTLYVALVVSHAVNDNVCAILGAGTAYVQSGNAGDPIRWPSHRDCKRASDSEFATFTLQCAPGGANDWTWQQAMGCATVAGPPESSWVSNSTCGPSSPAADWPPGVEADSTTSWVANVNAFQANGSPAWNMYVDGTDTDEWKSPFLAAFPDDVTQVPGYPTYSAAHEWEWSVVYEWSVDLGPAGANCGGEAIYFLGGDSHHSPAKSGPENDPFSPADDPPILSDYGDLPDSYGTLEASGGPRHYIKVSGPYLGSAIQTEGDGVPTADASGDGAEEDGVTAIVTGNWTSGSTQQFTVEVGNAPTGAVLAAWFDWDGDGSFSAGEYVTWPVVEGTNTLSLTVGAGFDWQTDALEARFRIFSAGTEAPGGSLDAGDFGGLGQDGEVEDYLFPAGALPVTLNAFTSEPAAGGRLTVRWQTASETDNVGFEVWGRVEGRWQPLGDFVPSAGMNSALPNDYETEIHLPPGVTAIELVDFDTRGRLERFGPFRPGSSYGEFQAKRRIDWKRPREQRDRRLADRGFAPAGKTTGDNAGRTRWRKLKADGPGRGLGPLARPSRSAGLAAGGGAGAHGLETGPMTHVAVTEPGIQRVAYEALRDGGLDLAGVPKGDIAVTWRGEPVARWITGRGTFGPGSAIEFIGRPPEGDDALYLDANLYQVSVDPALARHARRLGRGKARRPSPGYLRESMVDRPAMHHRQSPTGDPWIEQTVLVRNGGRTLDLEIPVDGPVLAGDARLVVGLGTVTDLADLTGPGGEVIPEHNVEVWFGGPAGPLVHLADASTSGQRDWEIAAEIPQGVLQPGVNRLQLRFATDYLFSLVLVDRYGVRYPSPYLGPELDFAADPESLGYRLEGFGTPSITAYAEGEDGSLLRVDPWVTAAGGGYAAELRQLPGAHYWVGDSPLTPAVFTTDAPDDLLAVPGDLVVIAESSFVGTRALDEYLAERAGMSPVVVDVEDIFNGAGFGMAVPSAITDYLRLRDSVLPFSHVQLVGADCYDRLNYVSDCVSFIPLPTAPVGVTTYSPSQNRLVDLDGDGVGDKAVAQFSVRDEAELATIVRKGATWRTSRLAGEESALLIAEETDGIHSFDSQIERLRRRLGWNDSDVLDMADHPDITTARTAMRSSLDEGRTLTVFSGHSSPSVWAFRSLLTAGGVAQLTNHETPTLIVPLACETTYDISPHADVLGHQLLYAGDQGALAISGAVALSSLADNERMAGFVLDGLNAGLTLGAAVQAGREALGTAFQTLQDNWLTQGDVAARIDVP